MSRKIKLINNNYYHIYNRGIDKRIVFLDKQDYYRFVHCLYEFNDTAATINLNYKFGHNSFSDDDILNCDLVGEKNREKLVEVLCFCFMPNHYHLLVKQLVDGGISKFMLKVGTGYVLYFNQKYKRTGRLFEGPFKCINIDTDEYLLHLSRYIHLNPVEIVDTGWKDKGISNWQEVDDFLDNYRWSSYLDYVGKKSFPSVTDRDLILEIMGGYEKYKEFVTLYTQKDIVKYRKLLLEQVN